jgi:polyphosphate kinase 2 (PPK2 family)
MPEAPWYVVEADDKRRARLNCIAHLLSMIPYHDVIVTFGPIDGDFSA